MGPKIHHVANFGLVFCQNYCHIWNQHLQICLIVKFVEKTKIPKFGTKNALFRYFWAGIWQKNCHILNQYPRICLIGKFQEIIKTPKFGTKNALCWYFWIRILKKLFLYLKSAPSNLSNSKISRKNKLLGLEQKMPKFGFKNALFGYFWSKVSYLSIFGLEFKKKSSYNWNQCPWICIAAKFGAKVKIIKFETKNA